MNTWSHFLVNAVLDRPIRKSQEKKKEKKLPKYVTKAFLIGSIMPDMMLILLSIGAMIYDVVVKGISLSQMNPDSSEALGSTTWKLFDVWFFENPIVITLHHLFGAPLLLFLYIGFAYYSWKKGKRWAPFLFWFAVGCLIHTAADIPLHTSDGPLIFYPFNWSYRFESPVSYWDSNHYGREWSIFEMGMDIVILLWLIGSWLYRKINRSQ